MVSSNSNKTLISYKSIYVYKTLYLKFLEKIYIHLKIIYNCNKEEPNLTTCWICFFYFNLCVRLLFLFTKRILSIHNGLPGGTLPLCLNVKPKCLCLGKHPDLVHLWMAARKKKLIHALPEAGHSR